MLLDTNSETGSISIIQKFGQGRVFYDFLKVPGGAEKVAIELARHFSSDLCVGYKDQGVADIFGTFSEISIKTLAKPPLFPFYEPLSLLRGFTESDTCFSACDWAIYSGTFAPLSVFNFPKIKNIMYCHTPPRFMYDMSYLQGQENSWKNRFLRKGLAYILKPKYEVALGSMDVLIANSRNVQNRIKRYLGKESIVIHPPCEIEQQSWSYPKGYYLSLARLETYKRVDLLIEAFLMMPEKKLIIASGGSAFERLKYKANNASNIYFTNWLNSYNLRHLIAGSIATLYIPKDEDFGMSPVESMAAGKPVIGVAEGGLLETIVHQETGILVEQNPSAEMIINAVKELTPNRSTQMRRQCEERAKLFSKHLFFRRIENVIATI